MLKVIALHASGLAEPEEVVLEELQVFKVSNAEGEGALPPTLGPGVGSRGVNPGEKVKLWHTLLKRPRGASKLLGELR